MIGGTNHKDINTALIIGHEDGVFMAIYLRPFEWIAHEDPVLGVRDGVRMVVGVFAHLIGRMVGNDYRDGIFRAGRLGTLNKVTGRLNRNRGTKLTP